MNYHKSVYSQMQQKKTTKLNDFRRRYRC